MVATAAMSPAANAVNAGCVRAPSPAVINGRQEVLHILSHIFLLSTPLEVEQTIHRLVGLAHIEGVVSLATGSEGASAERAAMAADDASSHLSGGLESGVDNVCSLSDCGGSYYVYDYDNYYDSYYDADGGVRSGSHASLYTSEGDEGDLEVATMQLKSRANDRSLLNSHTVWRHPALLAQLLKTSNHQRLRVDTGVCRALCTLISTTCNGYSEAALHRKRCCVEHGGLVVVLTVLNQSLAVMQAVYQRLKSNSARVKNSAPRIKNPVRDRLSEMGQPQHAPQLIEQDRCVRAACDVRKDLHTRGHRIQHCIHAAHLTRARCVGEAGARGAVLRLQ